MAQSLEQAVEVPVATLRVIRAALNSAHMQSIATDLVEQYRKLSNRQQYSALTKALEGALGEVEDLIEEAEKDDDDGDS